MKRGAMIPDAFFSALLLSAMTLPPPPKPYLLLVEDDPSQWAFFYEVLEPHYDVQVATSGTQAWEMAQARLPDIVLSDAILPGLDGFSLARRLRDHPATGGVPVILLSASSKIELLVRGLQAGAYDVLLKPVPLPELFKVLRERLEAREGQ